jgi:ssDNA-binding Zn-finger/Zn-ribbon topoisomerase 1
MELKYSPRFKRKWFYGCAMFPHCRATHGAHDDGRPLGIPGNKATKAARMRAHEAFDPLWKKGPFTRTQAYGWMCRALGIEGKDAHIGMFDIARCEKLIEALHRREACVECEDTGHRDGCEALEPAWDLADLIGKECSGCCSRGHKPSGMQKLQDDTATKMKELFDG